MTKKKRDLLGVVEYTPVFQFIISDDDLLKDAKHKVMPAIVSLVLGRMWRHSWGERGVCDASVVEMAKELRLSLSTVQRAIDNLESIHMVTDLDKGRRTYRDGKGRPHRYVVNVGNILNKHFAWLKKNPAHQKEVEVELPEQIEPPKPEEVEEKTVSFVNVRELKRSLQEE